MTKTKLTLLVTLLVSSAGCFAWFPEPPPGQGPDPEQLLADGWALYAQGRYGAAFDAFRTVEEIANEEGDNELEGRALNGVGWSSLRLEDFVGSQNAFDDAVDRIEASGERADALAGRAGVLLAIGNPLGARTDARSARELDPGYESFHDELDVADLTATALLASLRLGDVTGAQSELDRLDPSNDLDPDVPATWVVSGAIVPTYMAALLRAVRLAMDAS